MKKTFMINTRKSDGSMVQKGVLAQDSSATPPVPAIIVAIQAALATLETSLAASLDARITAITAAGDPPTPPAGYNGTAYVMGIQSANVAFRATIVGAQATLAAALAIATTRPDAHTARLNYDSTLGSALVVRSAALLALGSPPANPGQPS